jgi:hypothetical protein
MKDSIISFTKIDIVQLKIDNEIKHELATQDFIDRLKNAIINDVSKHHVSYNTEDGTYEMFHNGRKYSIYFGDKIVDRNCDQIDLIQTLNELVELSENQKNNQKFNGDVKEINSRSIEEIVKDGDDGIFYSEDDKVKYIKYIKEKLSKKSVLEGVKDIITGNSSKSADWNDIGGIVPGAIVGLIGIIGGAITHGIPYLIACVIGVIDFVIDLIQLDDDNTFLNFLAKKIVRFFQGLYYIAKNGINKSLEKRRLKVISKSIMESELSENISSKAPARVERKENSDRLTLAGESKGTIRKIYNKIAMIKDKELQGMLAVELDELIELFKKVPKGSNKELSEILYQLSYLDGKVSEEVKKQISSNAITMDFSRLNKRVDDISDAIGSNARRI